ncbi:MAG TPA: prepilin-type N-terminal cleavage/methylation domain-containing protein [Verrucomicrobiae bacterium]|nr:prepilin-type N-terminal cleavage/methylation domain-containing protein [Verrucomicrobiae bacterium]
MKTYGTKVTRGSSSGFTLAEMAIAMAIGSVVIAGMLSLFVTFLRSYNSTSLMRDTSAYASSALERMVYGVGTNAGLREAQASGVTVTYPSGGWQISYTNLYFQYTPSSMKIADQTGKTICTNIIYSAATNYTVGCRIWVTVSESAGGHSSTNAMSTFVQFRN